MLVSVLLMRSKCVLMIYNELVGVGFMVFIFSVDNGLNNLDRCLCFFRESIEILIVFFIYCNDIYIVLEWSNMNVVLGKFVVLVVYFVML